MSIQGSACVLHWALDRLPATGTTLPSANTGCSYLSSVLCPAQHLLPLTSCPPALSSWWTSLAHRESSGQLTFQGAQCCRWHLCCGLSQPDV